jgi:hypothetical protein
MNGVYLTLTVTPQLDLALNLLDSLLLSVVARAAMLYRLRNVEAIGLNLYVISNWLVTPVNVRVIHMT